MKKLKSIETRRQETVELMQKVENVTNDTVMYLRTPELEAHHADLIKKLTGLTIAKAALNARLTMLYEGERE